MRLTVLGLLLLLASACAIRPEFVILPHPTMEYNEYARTICSWNNIPVILADPSTLASKDMNLLIAHEKQHAEDMASEKGGCWPFIYRYQADSVFRQQIEYRAYCAEGKEALKQNRNPLDIWSRIKEAMKLYNVTLREEDNCLFNSSYLDTALSKPSPPLHTPDRE